MGGGGARHKFLLRAGWKHIFCIPAFENVSPGEGSDWVKETHYCKSRMEIYFSLVLLFFIFYCAFYYILCVKLSL